MLTKKGKYGLKALVHLARMKPGQVALVTTIAEANNIPKKFLEAILSDLRKAALVYDMEAHYTDVRRKWLDINITHSDGRREAIEAAPPPGYVPAK